ncbi:GNAT family N-acetyltransferase [Marinobacterium sp. LSUCC0821]|uniref:GNAT family N-acetyltransferase n=1 Tax=Marinobacterium sp. LSUCC0821 TaxID=2668067 RepID=UPI0014521B0B|nr:N-acetyltransferase [Marinobacterium sp. LSUCC0821]QJD71815.1 N-acetyltransferase [Marinobacterium sp. LSUCC0821]
MMYVDFEKTCFRQVISLFNETFTASEGETEGKVVADLVEQLLSLPVDEKVICFCAKEDESILAAVLFTQLTYSDDLVGWLLSPLAVTPSRQGEGIGQQLLRHAISKLSDRHESFLVTYGDPSFYSKVGFRAVEETRLPAPYKLSMPIGWLALPLSDSEIPTSQEVPSCVAPFRNPEIW